MARDDGLDGPEGGIRESAGGRGRMGTVHAAPGGRGRLGPAGGATRLSGGAESEAPVKRWLKWTLGIAGSVVVLSAATFGWMASRLPPDLELGSPVPAASFRDPAGKPIDLASFRGRPVFLDFWRST